LYAAETPPTTGSPIQTYPAADVLSFIGDTYMDKNVELILSPLPNWGQTATWDYVGTADPERSCVIIRGLGGGGDPEKKWIPIQINSPYEIKNYQYVHVDVYCNEPTSFRIGFHTNHPSDVEIYFPTIQAEDMTPGKWYSIEYPLSDLFGGTLISAKGEKWPTAENGSPANANLLRFGNELDATYSDEIYIDNVFVFNGNPKFLGGSSSFLKKVTTDDFTLYPTLVSSAFTWNSQKEIQKLTVYNITGQAVKSVESPAENTIDIAALSAGTYIVSVQFADGTTTDKRIVKA
jgi:hypothetical protein